MKLFVMTDSEIRSNLEFGARKELSRVFGAKNSLGIIGAQFGSFRLKIAPFFVADKRAEKVVSACEDSRAL